MANGNITSLTEVMTGSFVGILGGSLMNRLRLGATARSHAIVIGLINVGAGMVLGWLVSRVRVPLGAGIAAGLGGVGLTQLFTVMLAPSLFPEQPVALSGRTRVPALPKGK